VIKRIHHIGIGVRNLEEMVRFCTEKLELEVTDTPSWPGLKASTLPVGDVILELIEPSEPKLRVGESLMRLVQERGVAVHHLCLEVDDIDAELASLKAKGVKLIDEVAQKSPGGKIAWLSEDAVEGIMIELCEEGYTIG
jgi:methylmalonyl-CoA/ethylmalonyl-CoA epimerase